MFSVGKRTGEKRMNISTVYNNRVTGSGFECLPKLPLDTSDTYRTFPEFSLGGFKNLNSEMVYGKGLETC